MRPWGQDYNPVEMLDFCKVSPFEGIGYDKLKDCVGRITTAVMCIQSLHFGKPQEEIERLVVKRVTEIIEQFTPVSIGRSLDKLHSIATTGPELEGGRDGLDALTYHLSGDTCRKGIAALQAVMQRFEEDAARS
jgi:hypothetical protein